MTPPWDFGPEVNDHTVKLVNGAFVPKTPFVDGGIIVRALFQAAVSYRYGIGDSPDATKF
jgi:hypothetical protein